MSIRMNSYEKNLAYTLQRAMSKREAEEAILEIRYELYQDRYKEISPMLLHTPGGIKKIYPDKRSLLNAYYSGDFSEFLNNVSDDEIIEEKQEEENPADIWDVLPPRLKKKDGEGKKAYSKRIYSEFNWLTSVEAIDWQNLQIDVDRLDDAKKAAKVLSLDIKDDDIFNFENGYSETLNIRCDGLHAIALLYYMDMLGRI